MSADLSGFHAFTLISDGILREIISDVGISIPFAPTGKVISKADSKIHTAKALWDTGATGSCITETTAKALGLVPTGKAISNHAQGQSIVNTYLVNLYLPNNLVLANVRVVACAHSAAFGVIIGMDIITAGDFTITNVNAKTKVTFRMPSMKGVDYVEESNAIAMSRRYAGADRNAPCPCGSGKKFKQCHG